MKTTFETKGVCSRKIHIDITNGVVNEISFDGGCNGNASGIAALVKGMEVSEVIKKLTGIKCDNKSTSCPDQLAIALKDFN